ncbi:glycosyltransferase family A protein [Alkalihalophilus lindianensis]|uniref:Glycosyltransferase family A protein n=1 Tax=Alkalihalophilus lindianensis TaxID=1630542 RepID=A0ABU3X7P8_9BACI|nr:glycosyltransferase family A protein [Alkalihalophilus lindianensis]MDV2683298.1 glycosyltransferase family A protein [Alkalihalophilus lindianensis]
MEEALNGYHTYYHPCSSFNLDAHQPLVHSKSSAKRRTHYDQPLISVLVPMRNEERNVADLLASLSRLSYPNLEFIFLDDGSTDGTNSLLYQHSKPFKLVKILKGKPLPEGWIGKVHACYQLGREASGDYLAFIDADIRLAPTTLNQTLHLMEDKNVGFITGSIELISKLKKNTQKVQISFCV